MKRATGEMVRPRRVAAMCFWLGYACLTLGLGEAVGLLATSDRYNDQCQKLTAVNGCDDLDWRVHPDIHFEGVRYVAAESVPGWHTQEFLACQDEIPECRQSTRLLTRAAGIAAVSVLVAVVLCTCSHICHTHAERLEERSMSRPPGKRRRDDDPWMDKGDPITPLL